jgi:hypothetical protein
VLTRSLLTDEARGAVALGNLATDEQVPDLVATSHSSMLSPGGTISTCTKGSDI